MQVNDSEASHAQPDTSSRIEEEPVVVGSSVDEGTGHGKDVLGANFHILAQAELSSDAAHGQGVPASMGSRPASPQ
jgi:hypothetical protein